MASEIRLHFKVLVNPNIPINSLVENMRQVYSAAGIAVEVITTENLNLPHLIDVDVGSCTSNFTTAEQNSLFENRNGVASNDIVVYFVRSTIPPLNGCAAYPPGSPGAIVVGGASPWTLAHEVGHVLGLKHVDDHNRLMTGLGTDNITNPPPNLDPSELVLMAASQFISIPVA